MIALPARIPDLPRLLEDPPELVDGTVIVVDTETTGLTDDPEADIAEIGAVLWDTRERKILATFQTRAYPKGLDAYHQALLTQITGIVPELTDPPAEEARRSFWAWRASEAPGVFVTAYSVAFDQHFLPHPDAWTSCTLQFARRFGVRKKLVDLHAQLDLPLPSEGQPHRALYDATLAAHVLDFYLHAEPPTEVNLSSAPPGEWWALHSTTLPLPIKVRGTTITACSPAAHAILFRAQEINLVPDPAWAVDPPSAFLEHIPETTWARVWADRVQRIPILRESLLQTVGMALSGHPHAAALTALREGLSEVPVSTKQAEILQRLGRFRSIRTHGLTVMRNLLDRQLNPEVYEDESDLDSPDISFDPDLPF